MNDEVAVALVDSVVAYFEKGGREELRQRFVAGQPITHDHRTAARTAMQDGKAAAKANEVPVPKRFPATVWHGPMPEEANA